MLVSLLLSCLFFGLISMALPSDRRNEWIYLLLIAVLTVSFLGYFGTREILPEIPEESVSAEDFSGMFPESAALHSAVSTHITSLTGSPPSSVESDLKREGEGYQLSWIYVEIQDGNEKEVQYALQKAFSFEGFTVVKANQTQCGDDLDVSSEEQMDAFD